MIIAPERFQDFPGAFFLQKTCLPYFFFVLLQTDNVITFNDETDIYQS